jgi:hypothetical protein
MLDDMKDRPRFAHIPHLVRWDLLAERRRAQSREASQQQRQICHSAAMPAENETQAENQISAKAA